MRPDEWTTVKSFHSFSAVSVSMETTSSVPLVPRIPSVSLFARNSASTPLPAADNNEKSGTGPPDEGNFSTLNHIEIEYPVRADRFICLSM